MIPASLQQLLGAYLDAVHQHPQHALLPARRREIYDYLGPVSDRTGRWRRGWLALFAARRVLPLCQGTPSSFDRANRLLTLAEGVLRATVDMETATDEAEKAWDWITNDYGDRQEVIQRSALCALTSALQALLAAIGQDPFDDVVIKDGDTDSALDPWSSDAAKWAVEAVTGRVREPGSDAAKRLEFWTWWLTEAVPQAWEAGA